MINVLGVTFKENCPDIRNTQVFGVIEELRAFGLRAAAHNPYADPAQARREHGLELPNWEDLPQADAVLLSVAHSDYIAKGHNAIADLIKRPGVVVDVKSVFDPAVFAGEDITVWRL